MDDDLDEIVNDDEIDESYSVENDDCVLFDGPGYGMFNYNIYTITNSSVMMRNARCCLRTFRQIEMRLITDVTLTQTCCQRRKGAGVIRFFTIDPLWAGEIIEMKIPECVRTFNLIVKRLIYLREKFAEACGSQNDDQELTIYKGEGYYCCPCHCCNLMCPTAYKITTENVLEEKICCCCCHTTLNFLSIRRVFQVEMTQDCCQYCCVCCPDAGDITLWTTDDSAGNTFSIRIPHKAVRTFQRLRNRVDLETAMLERVKAKRMVGMALDVLA